ncbi:hypothetical protein P2P37_13885, partial [Escherichia coli]
MKRAPLITGLLLISTSCAYASSGGCGADSTSGATNYSSVVDDVTVNQTDNVTGREFTSATLSSTNWQYACSCSAGKAVKLVYMVSPWICPYISRHLLSLNPLQARCRRYSR